VPILKEKNRTAVPLLSMMTFTYWPLTTPPRILKNNGCKKRIHLGLMLQQITEVVCVLCVYVVCMCACGGGRGAWQL